MKKLIIGVIIFLSSVVSYGQIQYLRYNDDFGFLKRDSIEKRGFQKLKYIPLSDDVNISFAENYENSYNDMTTSILEIYHQLIIHQILRNCGIE